jgi:membrane protein
VRRLLARIGSLGRGWRPRLATARDFLLYLSDRIGRDQLLNNASTLSYTTLLSVVPLMAVGFSLLAAFPVFEPVIDRLQAFLFANLMPASSEVVQTYLERFASKATQLTVAGIAGLLVSALLMMSAVDKALNEIWHVPQARRPLQGFMVYWTLLTLGPLLIGASLAITSYVEGLSELAEAYLSTPRQLLFSLAPLFAETLAFLFLYAAVPNRRVPIRHAALGALLAAIAFEIAKRGFTWYVKSFPTYEAIYGALAALPLFLVWLYLSWTIILVGAEFTQALSGFRVGRAGALSDPRLKLILAVRIIGHLWYAQRHGRALVRSAMARLEPQAGELALQECLDALERGRVVLRTARGGWMLARDPGHYTLLDLYRSYPYVLPDPNPAFGARDEWDRRLAEALRTAARCAGEPLDQPLASLFEPHPSDAQTREEP